MLKLHNRSHRTVNHFEMKCFFYFVMVAIVLATVVGVVAADNSTESDAIHDSNTGHISDASNSQDDSHGNSSHDGDHGNGSHHEHHGIHVVSWNFDYVRQPLIVSLFMITVVLCKLGFHHVDFLSSWMPESCVLIILGTVFGGILHAANVDNTAFYYIHPPTFFLFLLPPCILEAAYGLHDPVFFSNLGTIILYAVVGTIINCFIIGTVLYGLAIAGAMGTIQIKLIECLVFSSLIVAVDPVAVLAIFQEIGVNSVLYFLVFGESLLNDAVTVVLYNTINTLSQMEDGIPASEIGLALAAFFTVSLGGLSIGIIFGIFSALITRITQHVRAIEPLAIFSLAYGAYLTAELFHFSGIISMIGCGLMQVRYAFHNISYNSTITVKYFIKMLSGACDSIIFMFLGVALVRDDHVWQTGFVLWSVFLCLAVRFMVTYFLTFIANQTNRERKVATQEQFIMAYGGLRGAVAFCLVAMLDSEYISNKNLFQTTTLIIILFTVFVQGITIKPLVKLLGIQGDNKVVSLYQEVNDHVLDHMLVFMEEVIGHYGHNTFKEWLDKIDDKYFKHWLQRDPLTKDEVIMELYQEIALQQHFENLYGLELQSSRLDLYQPSIQENPAAVDVSLHPAIMRRSLDHYTRGLIAMQRLSHQSNRRLMSEYSSVDDEEQNPNVYDTVRSLPAVMIRSSTVGRPEVQRFLSFSEEDKKEGKEKPRNRFLSRLGGADENGAFIPNPTSKDIRRWLIKSPNKDAFSRRTDRNLKNAEDSELLHLLHEKQLRHNRFIRAQSLFSPAVTPNRQMSPAGSISELPEEDGKPGEGKGSSQPHLLKSSSVDDRLQVPERGPRMRHKTLETEISQGAKEDKKIRTRHRTVDFEASEGQVKYMPRYVPKRINPVGGYRVVYRASVPDAAMISAGAPPSTKHRLPSIDEAQSAAVVDERSKRSEPEKADGDNAAGKSGDNAGNEEKAVLLSESKKAELESKSEKGRGHFQRQDADSKPGSK